MLSEEIKMAKYRPQSCVLVNRETSGGGNYANYCAPPGIYGRRTESGIFPENCAPDLYKGTSENLLTEYRAPRGTLEGDTFFKYKTSSNTHQDVQVLNRHTPPNRIKESLDMSKYSECNAPPLRIFTLKGDTFSEYHTPSNIYIGTLVGDKITEYRATQDVFKITPKSHKDAQYGLQIPHTINFDDLRISETPTSFFEYTLDKKTASDAQNLNPVEVNNEYPVHSSKKSFEEEDVFTYSALIPWEAIQNGKKDPKISELPTSDKSNLDEKEAEYPFPPILCRRKSGATNEDDCSLILYQPRDAESSTTTEEADTTCNKNVICECEDESICKCPKMRGKYYDYYMQMKEKEYYTMYPKGKCTLPKGTVLHFTGAPDNMKREDIKEALGILDAKIEFIDFQKGNKDGWVRLSFPHEARIIIKKMTEKKIQIGDAELVFRVLSGKEEKRYLKKVIEDIHKQQQKGKCLDKLLKKRGYKYVKNIN